MQFMPWKCYFQLEFTRLPASLGEAGEGKHTYASPGIWSIKSSFLRLSHCSETGLFRVCLDFAVCLRSCLEESTIVRIANPMRCFRYRSLHGKTQPNTCASMQDASKYLLYRSWILHHSGFQMISMHMISVPQGHLRTASILVRDSLLIWNIPS